jgi:DNA (cytosine-5)-methyltransferase 1
MLTSGHVFSGCGGDSLGAQIAGFTPIWAIENDKYAAAVYRHNFPKVNLIKKDIREISDEEIKALGKPSIIIAGSPCQDFSLSGSREGLAGNRSSLFFEFCRVLRVIEPQAFLWENVEGALSSNGGTDFKAIIRKFAELGYVGSWGTSTGNAAQSRKRIICVGINRKAAAQSIARGKLK